MTTSARIGIITPARSSLLEKDLSAVAGDPAERPLTQTPHPREAAMSAIAGRPSKHDQRARTARFLALCATGMRYDLAARQAGVKPERALRLVSDRDAFEATIQAMGTAA